MLQNDECSVFGVSQSERRQHVAMAQAPEGRGRARAGTEAQGARAHPLLKRSRNYDVVDTVENENSC